MSRTRHARRPKGTPASVVIANGVNARAFERAEQLVPCATCKGTGRKPGPACEDCPCVDCSGDGWRTP